MNDEQQLSVRIRAGVQRIAPIANGLLLIAFVVWLMGFDGARSGITELETLNSSHPVTMPTDHDGERRLAILVVGSIVGTFLTMLIGLWLGRRESRSIKAWLVVIFLTCGWLAAWLGRNDLYWYGHAMRVSSEVAAANRLATVLESRWPAGDGDDTELGFVLGYPKENPVSLILAGEPIRVGSLRIVAIDKSKDGATLRFQLADPNHDTWLVRSVNGEDLTEFVSGFDSHYTAARTRQLSRDWYLVRYDT